MVSLQSIIWVFLLNNFSRVINIVLTKLARDHPRRISALGLFCIALGPYCQDLRPIFAQYGPRAWLIKYMYVCTVLVQLKNRLRVVPLSFSPLSVTWKKTLQKKMATGHPWGKKHVKGVLFTLRISRGHFFSTLFYSHV